MAQNKSSDNIKKPKPALVARWRAALAADRPTKNAEAERLWLRDQKLARLNLARYGLSEKD